jgi:hypothetical protein
MPNPNASQLHVDGILSNVSLDYAQKQTNFVADKVVPAVPVQKQSDIYPIWSKADFSRSDMDKRGDGTAVKMGGFGIDTSNTYYADVYGLGKAITDRQRANARGELDIDRAVTRYLTNQALMKKEKVFAAKAFATGIWGALGVGTDYAGGSSASGNTLKYWSSSSSTPIADITNAAIAINTATGYMPNKLVLGLNTFNALAQNDDLLQRIKYTQRGVVTPDIMASVFGIDRVLVSKAVENTANEGQTATMAQILGKSAVLMYTTDGASTEEPSAMLGFSWQEFDGAPAGGPAILTRRDDSIRADVQEIQMAFDYKVTAADLGVFFSLIVQ